MTFQHLSRALVAFTLFFATGLPSIMPCLAQDSPPGVRVADLQDQLESGLKARLPAEFEFIAVVVQRVEDQQFSTGEVKSVFQWARRKNKRVPFPYLQRAMRIIAAQKDVEL